MPVRTADAEWTGTLREGSGHMRFGEGAFDGAYSFSSRFEEGTGTNPEELIAAAHAGCFSMKLSGDLGSAGFTPEHVATWTRGTPGSPSRESSSRPRRPSPASTRGDSRR
jgi:lipoyl-dependent peroxiredoxin